ncbi:MAG: DNA topoisomerase I, partial [Planctomycetaceae bacterium]|nr:DNA topoisomerase I [Planctomycetaceae bacterium]
TYMRTDSVNLSQEALNGARDCVRTRYGDEYLSPSPRQFTSKSKGAQEAHEAIRPAGHEMKPAKELGLKGDEFKLYELIWKRTVATQMAEARLTFQTVTIAADDTEFRASGRHIDFPGFFRAYVEGSDDPEAALDDQESALPLLKENQTLNVKDLEALSHETKPPARYTEASLVGKLENEGIGRLSTYSSIISTVQDRGYVRKNGSQLVPTFTALAVTRLLEDYFPNLVDYNFTARMEQTLDDIATGEAERLPYLEQFYSGNEGLEKQVEQKIEVIDPREACTLQLGELKHPVRVGKFGPYFEKANGEERVTASIPDEMAPADLSDDYAETQFQLKEQEPQSLGQHPEEDLPIYIKVGPYGPYVQLGDPTEEKPKPKRVGLTKAQDADKLTFDDAVALLSLPKRLGHHPETGKVVKVGVGMYGPYVLHDKTYGNFDKKTHTYEFEGKTYDVMNVTLDAAVDMLKNTKKRAAPTPMRELGKHPEDEEPIAIFEGRYGPYVKYKKINATIPKDKEVEKLTLEEALQLIEEKAAKKGTKKKATKKKTTTAKKKKKAAKKKTTKNKKAG